jgi:hypothetical protein
VAEKHNPVLVAAYQGHPLPRRGRLKVRPTSAY